jgi:putative membrane protein
MSRRDDPFVISADALAPAATTPADAPPPPDEVPTGAAMVRVTQLAGRPRRGAGLFWAVAGSLVALVVSVATFDYLTDLLARYPTLGRVAVALTALLLLLAFAHVVRELWAFRRLARIDDFRAEAAAVHASADRDAAAAFSERIGRFYAGRPELKWSLERLAAQRAEVLDADALLAMTERAAMEPLDAMARAEIEVAARAVATATAVVPIAALDVMAALSQNVRMIRRIAEIYGAHAGFFGSWRLLRLVAAHLLATGLVAVGDDMIGSVAGGHVLARLSKRFGEGVMNGALTARVGVASMDVCRPLPFAALPRPKVSNLVGRALAGFFQRDGREPEPPT